MSLPTLTTYFLAYTYHYLYFYLLRVTEKAAEVRAQAAEQRPAAATYTPPQVSQAAGTSAQQELPADSRAQSLHLCGFDISGVSIAGQVRVPCN